MAFTFGELFAGIGGMGLGLERAGMEVRWQVEQDPYCLKVLAKHWPDVKRYEDVRDVGAHNLESVDLICGGPPCQPVSQAGKRMVQDDDRWLWPEFARIIRELQPTYALMENVTGLLVRGFGDVLGDLAEYGYDAEWRVLGADAFGASQHRKRVWLLAYPHDTRLQGPIWCGQPLTAGASREAAHSEPLRSTLGYWPPGPSAVSDIPRMADGPTNRAHRLRALGNAVVPQVAEYIGRRIMSAT